MKNKLCLITSNLFFVEVFLARQIRVLEQEYDVTVIVNATEIEYRENVGGGARTLNVALQRRIAPLQDLRSLCKLVALFRKEKFEIIHSATPKAGLLAMTAALIARRPTRIHTFTGQVWQTRSGFMRWLLKTADKVTAYCATAVLIDGRDQYDFLVGEGVVSIQKGRVLGNGSICGVDIHRFRPDDSVKALVRSEFAIPATDILLLYMARLTVDKGALVMAEAFARLCEDAIVSVHLLMVGPDEENLADVIRSLVGCHGQRLHVIGYTREPQKYFAGADIFCLPSYREGFPMVLLNAAACGVPSIASRVHGSTDAIDEGVTGLHHDPGDVVGLSKQIALLAKESALRKTMGEAARDRLIRLYSEDAVTQLLQAFYEEVLSHRLKPDVVRR